MNQQPATRSILLAPRFSLLAPLSIVAAACALLITQVHGAEPGTKAGFRFNEIDDKSLGLWESDRPVLVYNFGEMSLPGVRAAGTRSSYVHPIYGLSGEVLTDDFPVDHYHHHGLFWGWPHVTVGGREYDLWKMVGIRIEFQRWLEKSVDEGVAKLGVENAWVVRDKPVMKEEAWFEIHPATDDERIIDVTLNWTPLEAITLAGAEEKGYGGVSLRFAPRIETAITIPTGRAKEDLLMARLPWADLTGKFKREGGDAVTSGGTLFVDPQHPDFPLEWMTRDYGALCPGWPGVKPKALPAGKTFTGHYRVWIHAGPRDEKQIAAAYKQFTGEQAVKDAKSNQATGN
jgi:hypothetical protein